VIGAHRKIADAEILVALRHGVAVQQDFFGRLERAVLAAVDGILLAFHGARVVKIIVTAGRHAQVGLFDAARISS